VSHARECRRRRLLREARRIDRTPLYWREPWRGLAWLVAYDLRKQTSRLT